MNHLINAFRRPTFATSHMLNCVMLIFCVAGFNFIFVNQVLPQIEVVDQHLAGVILPMIILGNALIVALLVLTLPEAWGKVVKHQRQNDAAGYNLVAERERRWLDWVGRSVKKRKSAIKSGMKS